MIKNKLKIPAIILFILTLVTVGSYSLNIPELMIPMTAEERLQSKKYFDDRKVISLCKASAKGDTEQMDKLLGDGVDLNAVGNNGYNPLAWLFLTQSESPEKRKSFTYLLENGADPIHPIRENRRTLLHYLAEYEDPWYLKQVLENGVDNIDVEIKNEIFPTPLLQAKSSGRYENFVMLLAYGANIEWRGGESPLTTIVSSDGYRYAWLLLQRGADYSVDSAVGTGNGGTPDLIVVIEGITYRPSVALKYGEEDIREKVIEFLREKGVEVNPYMPEDEEYRLEGGKKVLYIHKNDGEWVRYLELSEADQEQWGKKGAL